MVPLDKFEGHSVGEERARLDTRHFHGAVRPREPRHRLRSVKLHPAPGEPGHGDPRGAIGDVAAHGHRIGSAVVHRRGGGQGHGGAADQAEFDGGRVQGLEERGGRGR